MEARNAAARGPVAEGSLGAEHTRRNRRLRELDWKYIAVRQAAAAIVARG